MKIETYLSLVIIPEESDDCWGWKNKPKSNGYCRYQTCKAGKWVAEYIHRFSYTFFVGPIPEGYTVDHKCRNRQCSNPAHLQAITLEANVSLVHTRAKKETVYAGV